MEGMLMRGHTLEESYRALVIQLRATGQTHLIEYLTKPEGYKEEVESQRLTQEEVDQLLAESQKQREQK
jgi:hypothetical protein